MTTEAGRAAMKELDRLNGHLLTTVIACVEAGLDVGELLTVASIVQSYAAAARVELDAPAPLHPRCGQRHDPAEPCPPTE